MWNKETNMKIKLVIVSLLIFLMLFLACKKNTDDSKNELKGNVTISGAWALYPMVVKWAEEYQKLYPGVKIDISAGGAGKGMADTLAGVVDIGMISRNIYDEEIAKGAFPFAVTIDAVVPTINAKNPNIDAVFKKGLTKEDFINIWITGKIKYWQEIIGGNNKTAVNVYTRSDACGAAETWAKYLGKKQENLQGVGVYADPGLTEAVKKDELGIGYNNINYAYDVNSKLPVEGIRIIPIDLNENGQIDDDENFYGDRASITDAIRNKKYPSPPSRVLFLTTKDKPESLILKEFLKWILTDGQKYVEESGYIKLGEDALGTELRKLAAN